MRTLKRRRNGKMRPQEILKLLADGRAATEVAQQTSPERAKAVIDERARELANPPAQAASAEQSLEVVTFMLAEERYGIETSHVREVVRLVDFTPLPGTPDFLVGVTNLRGEILAVVDLRKFLGVPGARLTDLSRLIVLGSDRAEFGLLADTWVGVVRLRADEVLEPPEPVAAASGKYARGVTKEGVVLLDGAVLLTDARLFIDQSQESGT